MISFSFSVKLSAPWVNTFSKIRLTSFSKSSSWFSGITLNRTFLEEVFKEIFPKKFLPHDWISYHFK